MFNFKIQATVLYNYNTFDIINGSSRQYKIRNVRNDFLQIFQEHLNMYPTAASISYLWSFGSLAGFFLVVQIITGIILVMHYKATPALAFDSVVSLMNNVPYGWLIRYAHSNGASLFFIVVYLHIARGLYYGSYQPMRRLLWLSGMVIFLILMGTAFIGYVLPWGQMSLWGATVITNLISAVPYIGERLVYWIWGNFSIGGVTLNRLFSLHYFLPFVIAFLVIIHLSLLHRTGSSTTIGGTMKDYFRISFYPYFYLKDFYGLWIILLFYVYLIFFDPDLFGHPDNYIIANAMVTPAHIVPEWYFLPFYAILRSIPNKFGGVLAMVGAIVMIMVYAYMSWFQTVSKQNHYLVRSLQYLPISKLFYWVIIINFLILGYIGGQPIEDPYLIVGQIATCNFFIYWFIAPTISMFEYVILVNTLIFQKNFKRSYQEFEFFFVVLQKVKFLLKK